MLIATGKIPLSAEKIDHAAPREKYPPPIRATTELGKHLATTCTGCHGPGLSGGEIVGGDPKWAPAQNITFHETGLGKWSRDDFRKALSEGVRPDGTRLKPPMPVAYTKNFREAEMDALYLYLKTVPPKAFGGH
jgi:mono/diheme cytochrome c family protein